MGLRVAREDVLAKHLRLVSAQRARVAAALERLPSAQERDRLRDRDEDLALVERGFGVLLPSAWGVSPGIGRPVSAAVEALVLAGASSTAAVLALRLQQHEDPLTSLERSELAAAIALHAYADAAASALTGPTPPTAFGAPRWSRRDAVVSKHLRLVRARMRDLELILTGRGAIIVPTLAEQARFQAELRDDDLLERAFTELLPTIWPVTGVRERRVGLVHEARVLVQLRAAAARVALAAQAGSPDDDRLALATALFRYAHHSLAHFDFDDNEMLPGGSIRYERIVAYAMFGQRWGSI
jgi:hypothetical protein